MKSRIVDVPDAPPPKSYRIELKVVVFIKTVHLSTKAIEQAIYDAAKSRDAFALITDTNIQEV